MENGPSVIDAARKLLGAVEALVVEVEAEYRPDRIDPERAKLAAAATTLTVALVQTTQAHAQALMREGLSQSETRGVIATGLRSYFIETLLIGTSPLKWPAIMASFSEDAQACAATIIETEGSA